MKDISREEAAQAFRALRRMNEPRVCQVCGKDFIGASYAKYCGKVCQQKAYRVAHQDELNRKRREKYQRQKAS